MKRDAIIILMLIGLLSCSQRNTHSSKIVNSIHLSNSNIINNLTLESEKIAEPKSVVIPYYKETNKAFNVSWKTSYFLYGDISNTARIRYRDFFDLKNRDNIFSVSTKQNSHSDKVTSYFDRGLIIKVVDENLKSINNQQVTHYFYDENNRLIGQNNLFSDGSVVNRICYSYYESEEKIIRYENILDENLIYSIWVETKIDNGYKLEVFIVNDSMERVLAKSLDSFSDKIEYTFFVYTNLEQSIAEFSGFQKDNKLFNEYFDYANGQLETLKLQIFNQNALINETIYQAEYKSSLVSGVSFCQKDLKNGKEIKKEFSYTEYDSFGNCMFRDIVYK